MSKGGNVFCERLPSDTGANTQFRTCSRATAHTRPSRNHQLEISKHTVPSGKRLM